MRSILVTVHSEHGKEQAGLERGPFCESVLRIGRGSGAGYLAVSDPVEEYLHEVGISADLVTMVRDAVPDPDVEGLGDPAVLRRELGLPDDAFVLATVARLRHAKGHRFVVEALASLRDELPHVHWLIVGEGRELDDLVARVERAGVTDRAHFPVMTTTVGGLPHAYEDGEMRSPASQVVGQLPARTRGHPVNSRRPPGGKRRA